MYREGNIHVNYMIFGNLIAINEGKGLKRQYKKGTLYINCYLDNTNLLSSPSFSNITMFHIYSPCRRWLSYHHDTISVYTLETNSSGTKS
jgi:hypothetical protein